MKNRAIMLITVFLVLYAGFNLPSCDVDQIALTEEHIKEAMALAHPLEPKIAEYFISNNIYPNTNKEIGLPVHTDISGKYVHSVRVYYGTIIIKFNENILNGGGFKLKPSQNPSAYDDIEWRCEIGSINEKYFFNVAPPCLFTASDNMEDLMNGVFKNDLEKIELALDAGANIDGIHHGETPLMLAISRGKTKMVKYLLDQGADIEKGVKYYNNRTPLMFAVRNANFEIVKTLIDNGADVNAKHKSGKRVIDFVEYNGKIRDYLYENGVDGNPNDHEVDLF
jgi:hypothetical protein